MTKRARVHGVKLRLDKTVACHQISLSASTRRQAVNFRSISETHKSRLKYVNIACFRQSHASAWQVEIYISLPELHVSKESGTGGWFRTNCLVDHNHAL